MSIARHHAEWLSLVEVSGPFLSLPVLLRAFPQGLPARDPELSKETKLMFGDWLEGHKDRAVHIGWCNSVIRNVLQFPPEVVAEGQTIPPGMEAHMSEYGEVLRPSMAILPPKGAASPKPRLLIQILPPSQDLEKPLRDKHWKASPATRMTELLHAADVPLGLITNGEHWMLVHAPRGETSGFASWYAPLWFEEPLTFQAFVALLAVQRFFGVPDDQTIEALLNASTKDQQEVTEQLGWQVRKAVEALIQSLDKIDQDHDRKLLEGVGEKMLYEAALTVMMRLVFLMCAEERKIFFQSESEQYDQFYAISTLRDQLQEVADKHVEEVLDARFDAWGRLLATFRAVYGGVQHEAMRLPPYGGTLFDPDRFPFLEGRKPGTHWRTAPAEPIKVSNRTVLHLLNALQILQVNVPGGGAAEARRISFRALDIEQIGHVYEGLLDHTAKRANEPVLGLKGSKAKEPEIALSKLEGLAGVEVADRASARAENAEPFLLAAETPGNINSLPKRKSSGSYNPQEKLVEFIKEETGRSVGAIKRELTDQSGVDEGRLLLACGHDRELLDRVWRFAALLRYDTFGFPVVIPTGSVYVTQGSDRRSTGTHYTPRSLTEPIVQHTLEPLVYIGPAEGKPKAEWKLKSAREILALKVCDMTMGSGAFLVQTCRYLAERLVEAWENAEKANPGKILSTPEGDFSEGDPKERIIPTDLAERLAIARRYVADRCLYGVDINHMAVEMAKLSLWLITLQRDRPFTFLDHALKCGDSLLGVSAVKQIENFTLRAKEGEYVEHTFATANLFRCVEEASAKRRALEDLPSNDHTQIEAKNRFHADAEAATAKVKALADCLIAFELLGLDGEAYAEQRTREAEKVQLLMDASLKSLNSQLSTLNLQSHAREQLRGRRPFHWPVEFPEVFARSGFDAFVGNPPFIGGKRISTILGAEYREFIAKHIAMEVAGSADYSAFFLLSAATLLSRTGTFGLIATDMISKGGTRDVGLGNLLRQGMNIFRAVNTQRWPGTANQNISQIWASKQEWRGDVFLGSTKVSRIGSDLQEPSVVSGDPKRLGANKKKAFVGTFVNGTGFILTANEAKTLLDLDSRNSEVIQPYLIGEDLNSSPTLAPSRWIINFYDWPIEKASGYRDCFNLVTERVKPERDIIVERGKQVHEYDYWKFWDKRLESYEKVNALSRVLVTGLVSKYVSFSFARSGIVFAHKLGIFMDERSASFAVLQSSFHSDWAWKYTSTLGGSTINYSLTDAFETFPFPPLNEDMDVCGENYFKLRQQLMLQRNEGLTDIYNRFHDRGEQSADIARLRELHVEMDHAVAAAYGWSDLDLGHGFHETKQGVRYTLSEPARRTVLDRLLALNHQRYAEEVKAGLHDKGAKKGKAKKLKATTVTPQCELSKPPQPDLFG